MLMRYKLELYEIQKYITKRNIKIVYKNRALQKYRKYRTLQIRMYKYRKDNILNITI